MTSKVALVTGATGFLGSHIAAACHAAGFRVRYTARPTSDSRALAGLPAERVTLDFAECGTREGEANLAAAVRGAAVVVHAAGITRARVARDFERINAEGTGRLACAAAEEGVRRFVFISSLAARGPDGRHADVPAASVPNRDADAPVSPYGRSKLEAERRLLAAAAAAGAHAQQRAGGEADPRMRVAILRPAGIYGPRDRELLPLFRLAVRGWMLAPPGGRLQPIYVTDVAAAAVRAAIGGAGPGPYALAESGRYTWANVAAALEEVLGRTIRRVELPGRMFEWAAAVSEWAARLGGRAPFLDRRRARDLTAFSWTCDPTAAETALGWRAEVTLVEGLRKTAAWYREAGWLPPA